MAVAQRVERMGLLPRRQAGRDDGFCFERSNVRMRRTQRYEHSEGVRLMLSGRIEAEHLPELRRLIEREDRVRGLTLDLREVKLVDRDAVTFLAQCEAAGATLENGPAYVREWIARERAESNSSRRKTRTRRHPERRRDTAERKKSDAPSEPDRITHANPCFAGGPNARHVADASAHRDGRGVAIRAFEERRPLAHPLHSCSSAPPRGRWPRR